MEINQKVMDSLAEAIGHIEKHLGSVNSQKYMVRVKDRIDLVLGKTDDKGRHKIIQQSEFDLSDIRMFNSEGAALHIIRTSPYRNELEAVRVQRYLLGRQTAFKAILAAGEKTLKEKKLAES